MPRVTKKPDERRTEIIEAANKLFNAKSYESTTMNDVMVALGIAKGTIYHYFKSKEELLAAVVDKVVTTRFSQIEIKLETFKGDALAKIRFLVREMDMSKEHSSLLDGLHKPENAGMHLQMLVATLQKCAPILGGLIDQGCHEGIFRTDFPEESAEFILSGVQFLTDKGICPWATKDLQRRMQAFPQIIENMLQAKSGSFAFLLHAPIDMDGVR